MCAAARDAAWRRPYDLDGPRLHEAALDARHDRPDAFAGQRLVHEHDEVVEPADAAPFHGGAVDIEFDRLTRARLHATTSLRVANAPQPTTGNGPHRAVVSELSWTLRARGLDPRRRGAVGLNRRTTAPIDRPPPNILEHRSMSRRLLASLVISALLVPALAAAETEKYTVDPNHTEVGFTVRHFVSKVPGRFKQFSGEIQVDPKDPTTLAVDAKAMTASISTDNENRDKHLQSPDFFDAATYPELTFKSKSATKNGDKVALVGDLTMRGVTKEVTFQVEPLGFQPIPRATCMRGSTPRRASIARTSASTGTASSTTAARC
jgi:polyisoprenoid-binding protein YceI